MCQGGYGYSAGEPSQEGLIRDARAALQWVSEQAQAGRVDGSKLVLCGRSLGGAVAIHLAHTIKHELASSSTQAPVPKCLIVENSFTSISDVVDFKFPFLNIPFFKEYFLRLKWKSVEVIGEIPAAMLFLSSKHDEIVPAQHMGALRDAATAASATEFHEFEATHNDIWVRGGSSYWNAKKMFLVKHAGGAF